MHSKMVVALACTLLVPFCQAAGSEEVMACHQAVVQNLQGKPPPFRSLAEEEIEQVNEINARARVLAAAYSKVIDKVREAGMDPNEFPAQKMSWAAVIAGDEVLVGVYKALPNGSYERTSAFGSEGYANLVAQLGGAEQVLAVTPNDCGRSFGSLDAGIVGPDGNRLVYSLRLTDRRVQIPWGMHYRYVLADGAPVEVEALHFRCATLPAEVEWREGVSERARARILARYPVTEFEIMPNRELPTEAQIMQFHLHQDLPYTGGIEFVLRGRRMHMDPGTSELPTKFREFRNPCETSESGAG